MKHSNEVEAIATEIFYEQIAVYAPRLLSAEERLALNEEVAAQYGYEVIDVNKDVEGREFIRIQRKGMKW